MKYNKEDEMDRMVHRVASKLLELNSEMHGVLWTNDFQDLTELKFIKVKNRLYMDGEEIVKAIATTLEPEEFKRETPVIIEALQTIFKDDESSAQYCL